MFVIYFDEFLSFWATQINEKSMKNRIQNAIQDGKVQFCSILGENQA